MALINEERLWDRLMQLSDIGKQVSGGITRLSFSKEERDAKQVVASFMKEAGLTVREDEVGNLIGRMEGKHSDLPTVLVGSHVDSVYNGGNFDGPLGVLSGVEALQTMNEQGIKPDHPIEVIAFTDEEGARFSYGMIGSRGIAGTLEAAEFEKQDKEGISIAEAMREAGHDPSLFSKAAREKGTVKAYVEVHIEQGKILEKENLSVGIVTGIAGPLWLKFILEGEAGHAGTTPMGMRRDSLVAAGKVFEIIETEASKTGSTVGTVGQLALFPGGINIIPGRVEFALDMRDVTESVRDEVERNIVERAHAVCEERGIKLTVELLQRVAPAPCSKLVQQASANACETLGLQPFSLPSGAGHDGMQLTELCPIGMIFVRSKDGISHNPLEWSSKEDCRDGANVLYQTLLQLAKQAS
jgi:allantoate deiminase